MIVGACQTRDYLEMLKTDLRMYMQNAWAMHHLVSWHQARNNFASGPHCIINFWTSFAVERLILS